MDESRINRCLYGSLRAVDEEMEQGSEETVLIRAAIQNVCRQLETLQESVETPDWRQRR